MNSKFKLLCLIFFISQSTFAQKRNISDSLKCTQYFDTLSNRQLYRFPEKNAEYKGGAEGFSNYINRHFSYDNKKIDHQVILIFTFIVEPDGLVSNVSLKYHRKDVPDDIVDKGVKALQKMPKLTPAECNNQKVAIRLMQPIVLYPARN
ncbi:MAG TPA: hypothetical protein VG890_08740 [Puia sp.]|nr:hypothetical protein [Puia sp.]